MGFLKKLFGGGAKPSVDPSQDPNMIRVYDAYGQELYIPKEEWRKKVLPRNIQNQWNNPDALAALIVGAFHDEFIEEMLEPAQRLLEIDPDSERAAVLLAIALMKTKRLNEAEQTLRNQIEKHGETGTLLTNLAKIHAERGDNKLSEETLWRSLQLDPNQDNGLLWYAAIQRERGGPSAWEEALLRIAAIPSSWRAQLFIARERLETKNLEAALELYRNALDRAPNPAPPDLLVQISGDLGNAGFITEIPNLIGRYFDPAVHGLMAGNNLIKAHVELKDFESARRILDHLYQLKRPDWSSTLSFWDTEIAKQKLAGNSVLKSDPDTLNIGTIEGPVWLPRSSSACTIFPSAPTDAPIVAFVGSTVERHSPPEKVEMKLADDPGRLSRAIPLFLAEQVEFHMQLQALTLVPWVSHPAFAFAVLPSHQSDQALVEYVNKGCKSAYVVTSHLIVGTKSWNLRLRMIRCSDGKCVEEFDAPCASGQAGEAVLRLAGRLFCAIETHMKIVKRNPPTLYQLPPPEDCVRYLYRIEQLLALRLSSLNEGEDSFLSGERDILAANLQLCLAYPDNVPVRLILIYTFKLMQKIRPDVAEEFKEKIVLLQKEHPLVQSAHEILQAIIEKDASSKS